MFETCVKIYLTRKNVHEARFCHHKSQGGLADMFLDTFIPASGVLLTGIHSLCDKLKGTSQGVTRSEGEGRLQTHSHTHTGRNMVMSNTAAQCDPLL